MRVACASDFRPTGQGHARLLLADPNHRRGADGRLLPPAGDMLIVRPYHRHPVEAAIAAAPDHGRHVHRQHSATVPKVRKRGPHHRGSAPRQHRIWKARRVSRYSMRIAPSLPIRSPQTVAPSPGMAPVQPIRRHQQCARACRLPSSLRPRSAGP